MAFERRTFSWPLPDYQFNDLEIITTIYCKQKNHTLGMIGRLNCNNHVGLYVVSHIDALRDENFQVFPGVFTF